MDQSKGASQNRHTSPALVLKIIYSYMIGMHIVLPVIVFFLYPPKEGTVHSFALVDLFPADFSQPVFLAVYGVAFVSFVAGFVIPKIIGRRGAAKFVAMMAHGQLNESSPITQSFAPYMLRLVLFEMTTLCGFVAAFWAQTPQYILPFAFCGVLGAFLSPPSEDFIKSMTN